MAVRTRIWQLPFQAPPNAIELLPNLGNMALEWSIGNPSMHGTVFMDLAWARSAWSISLPSRQEPIGPHMGPGVELSLIHI